MGAGWEIVVDNHQELRYNRDDRSAADRSMLSGMAPDETRDSLIWSQNRTLFPPVVGHDQGFRAELARALIQFVLANPLVDVALIGMRSPERVEQNVAICEAVDGRVDIAELYRWYVS